ncbi:MAG: anaerobic sulfatase maturase [Pontiellaceae bacterium]|nr:anaerobic sulfatase maturase [Pontiellaceae bacterium]
MAKPVGSTCNLACEYCFYLEKEQLFSTAQGEGMSDSLLENFIRDYVESQPTADIHFTWQGGEPTLAGLDFFRKAVDLQKKHAGGRPVHNAIQTNGTQLDDEWCRFLADEHFLVGLSLDGPKHIHDRYRVTRGGQGSFDAVMRALELLKKRRVEFNTLTCVTRESTGEALEIYRFLKKQGVRFMQFIPIVERDGEPSASDPVHREHERMMPWAVASDGLGIFLSRIFDEWIKADVGRVFVNMFDVVLSAWCGMEPVLCTFSRQCGNAVAMEHDGSLYSCDHYVYPSYHLGNLSENPLEAMVFSDEQRRFGRDKQDALPQYCRHCRYLFACNGGCPKHRFTHAPDGEPGLNYLCAGYRLFFEHVDQRMRRMAMLVRSGRPAAEIMADSAGVVGKNMSRRIGRNDLCPCGSGIKFKKCCGA